MSLFLKNTYFFIGMKWKELRKSWSIKWIRWPISAVYFLSNVDSPFSQFFKIIFSFSSYFHRLVRKLRNRRTPSAIWSWPSKPKRLLLSWLRHVNSLLFYICVIKTFLSKVLMFGSNILFKVTIKITLSLLLKAWKIGRTDLTLNWLLIYPWMGSLLKLKPSNKASKCWKINWILPGIVNTSWLKQLTNVVRLFMYHNI